MTAQTMESSYRGGWRIHYTAIHGGWDKTAIRGDREVRQGTRTPLEFLNALDRIDGRSILGDYIERLGLGMSREEASRPWPHDDQGNPIRGAAAPPPPPPPQPAPVWSPGPPPVGQAVQQSLFDF